MPENLDADMRLFDIVCDYMAHPMPSQVSAHALAHIGILLGLMYPDEAQELIDAVYPKDDPEAVSALHDAGAMATGVAFGMVI